MGHAHHSAGHSAKLSGRLAQRFADNIRNLREIRPLRNPVTLASLG